MSHLRRLPPALLLAAGLFGCADDPEKSAKSAAPAAPAGTVAAAAPAFSPASGADKQEAVEGLVPLADVDRKIIYNARLDLVTEDLAKLDSALARLIAEKRAYVADSERTGAVGSTRLGTWKVRVPVDAYDAFLKGAVALGELVSLKADSQDVGEEYADLDARQAAKKVEEARLLKHLDVSTGKLEEILAVERELSRVRGEIERMQGRLRYLGNLTALATVTIIAREIKDYVPPRAPTLATRVGRTFADSLAALQAFGEAILLFLVALAPWLPLILIGLGLAYWLGRRAWAWTHP